MNTNRVLAVALLAGTIIGAGIFSLPYLISRTGLISGFFYFLFFGCVYYVIHKMYADLLQQSDTAHQFSFVAKRFLPRFAARVLGSAVFLELIFVLVVYLILAPSFLSLITERPATEFVVWFWALGSFFLFARLSWIGWAEFSGVVAIIGIIGAILWKGWGSEITTPVFVPLNIFGLLLPVGPLLFSLSGRPAIAKVVEEWRKAKNEGKTFSLSRAIAMGTAIPVVLCVLFVLGVLLVSPNPSMDAISGLGSLSPIFSMLLGMLGFLTLWTSYGMIAVNVRDTLRDDAKIGRFVAYTVPICVPLALYILGVNEFLGVLSFTGSVFLGLEGIAIVWMWRRAFPDHSKKWITVPLFIVFGIAIFSEVIKYF